MPELLAEEPTAVAAGAGVAERQPDEQLADGDEAEDAAEVEGGVGEVEGGVDEDVGEVEGGVDESRAEGFARVEEKDRTGRQGETRGNTRESCQGREAVGELPAGGDAQRFQLHRLLLNWCRFDQSATVWRARKAATCVRFAQLPVSQNRFERLRLKSAR